MKKYIAALLIAFLVASALLCGCNGDTKRTVKFEKIGVQFSYKCNNNWYSVREDDTVILAKNKSELEDGRWYCVISVSDAYEKFENAAAYLKDSYEEDYSEYTFTSYGKQYAFGEAKNKTEADKTYFTAFYNQEINMVAVARFMSSEVDTDTAYSILKSMSIEEI